MQDWACPGHWNTAQAQGREEQHWALNRTWNLSLRFALTPSLRSDSSGRLLQHWPHCWLQVCRLCPGFCLAVDLDLVKGYKPKLEGNLKKLKSIQLNSVHVSSAPTTSHLQFWFGKPALNPFYMPGTWSILPSEAGYSKKLGNSLASRMRETKARY